MWKLIIASLQARRQLLPMEDPEISDIAETFDSMSVEASMAASDNATSSFTEGASDLGGGEITRLFDVIDRLRECGVAEDISLPQVRT